MRRAIFMPPSKRNISSSTKNNQNHGTNTQQKIASCYPAGVAITDLPVVDGTHIQRAFQRAGIVNDAVGKLGRNGAGTGRGKRVKRREWREPAKKQAAG